MALKAPDSTPARSRWCCQGPAPLPQDKNHGRAVRVEAEAFLSEDLGCEEGGRGSVPCREPRKCCLSGGRRDTAQVNSPALGSWDSSYVNGCAPWKHFLRGWLALG